VSVVKICGLRDAQSAIVAARSGADLLGFIFAPSRRQVGAELVAAIISEVRAAGFTTPAVGVFVDPDPAELAGAIAVSGIDVVQLSGEESPDVLGQIDRPVIKGIPAGDTDSTEAIMALVDQWSGVQAILLDASDPHARGGTGKRANWDLAAAIARETNVLLAGGLDSGNVSEAVASVQPYGVDVSTGVETDGVKDPAKIGQFIAAARQAFN
jgi:phosphoribosylanthranilate isomerase